MGKYLKLIESSSILEDQNGIIDSYKDRPLSCPTVFCFKNPETDFLKPSFVNRRTQDIETDFTWKFGYKDGHPGIYFTFYAKNEACKNHIFCLETNSSTCKINKTINVFTNDGSNSGFSIINEDYKYLTWWPMSEIMLNKEYFIYIIGNKKGPWHWVKRRPKFMNSELPSDWEIRINIRPTIRSDNVNVYSYYKALPKYKKITYLYNTEYHI